MQLRDYQQDMLTKINSAWAMGIQNPLAVLPCGSGKTVLFSHILAGEPGASCCIAHRSELVSQTSLMLARYGVRHRILAPMPTIKWIIGLHAAELGTDFYDSNSRCAVAGVDTIMSWAKPESKHHAAFMRWAPQVKLWVIDEAAHLCRDNKWGKAVQLFTNARGLGVTATPERSDGKGLGRHADGLIDIMFEGPGMRDMINAGWVTDYRILCPPNNLHLENVAVGSDGDYQRGQLATATKASTIFGDVVSHYQRFAAGKLGITFAPDVETAGEIALGFNRAGIPAEVVSAKTPGNVRMEITRRFKKRELLQLVNCDIFGEGYDLPAIEVVSMARATQSYSLYVQQFGRGCRPMGGKERAIILDHVGNCLRHNGPPDVPHAWSLDRREKRSSGPQEGVIPIRVCLNPVCMAPYERVLAACPFCGWVPVPAGRTAPEQVDGDLHELDAATLAAMRGEVAKVDRHPDEVLHAMERAGHGYVIAKSIANKHEARQRAQTELRLAISWYGGTQRALGRPDAESYKRFYFSFGVDVLSAQALGRADAEALTLRINSSIGR